MTVTQLITAAFILARSRYPELDKTWISISVRGGGLLPNSLLMASVQRTGELDMVLRCMEDDFSPAPEGAGEVDLFSFNYQKMLSELWVGAVYEIFRLLRARKLILDNPAFKTLAHDLELLRISLEKHEIPADKKLTEPLLIQRSPPNNDKTDIYYSKSDPQRAYIMPSRNSGRGSVMWQVFDVKSGISDWLDRRTLSERIVALWEDFAPVHNS